jgi:hypothetical protein
MVQKMSMQRKIITLTGFGVLFFFGGCDFTRLTANTTVKLFERAAPAFEEYWDYDLAGEALPASIIQLEGILRVVPDNEALIKQLLRSYMGYAYGWVEDASEVALAHRDFHEANVQRLRARTFYERAKSLGEHWISLKQEGMDEVILQGLTPFESWLEEHFEEEEDAPALLWAGYAWGSYINMSRDDMAAVADLSYAKALVLRSVELDEDYFHAAGLTFLGVATSNELGADLGRAKGFFERALELSERNSLVIQVNMARHYATQKKDIALYQSLLREVLNAGDINPSTRLTNQIAKRRAARYLRQTRTFFPSVEMEEKKPFDALQLQEEAEFGIDKDTF